MADLIQKYFPLLTEQQLKQFRELEGCYKSWNEKINVISRKDIDHLYERHVLHSLAMGKLISFKPGTLVLDVGTGGGFPGIPLAILFPEVHFTLVDATAKKIKVVQAVIEETGLKNVNAYQARVETMKGSFDFVVSRAVAPLQTICNWTRLLLSGKNFHEMGNGWLILKGGDLGAELQELKKQVRVIPVRDYFEEPWFMEKYIVYIQKVLPMPTTYLKSK